MNADELADQFADALIALSKEGRVLFWSGGAEELFGCARAEAMGRTLHELSLGLDVTELGAHLDTALTQGHAQLNTTYRRPDGAPVELKVTVRRVSKQTGEVSHLVLSTKDMSDPGLVRQVAQLGERCSAVLDAVPEAMLIMDELERVVLFNAAAEALFGKSRREVIGGPLTSVLPADLSQAARLTAQGKVAEPHRDVTAQGAKGRSFLAELNLGRMVLPEGAFLSVTVRDATARRSAEGRIINLLEAMPDAVVVVAADGKVVRVNAQAERIFGWALSALEGQSVEVLVPWPKRQAHQDHRHRYGESARPRPMHTGLALQALRQDGQSFPVEISLSPLDIDGEPHVIAAIRDVTAQREAQRALELANTELEAFGYAVAHDLRAPLRGIDGFSQVLLEEAGPKLTAEARDAVAEIRANVGRMGARVDALLQLARVNQRPLEREKVDVTALAHEEARACELQAPGRKVRLSVQESLEAEADVHLVRALLQNLLCNAWKFTRHVPVPSVDVGADVSPEGETLFWVRDNGAGFDAKYQHKLFSPFARLHSQEEFEGTGIGLATARRIVHRHGGRIWATAQVGKGATFFFTLWPRHGS